MLCVTHTRIDVISSPPGQNGRHVADDLFRCTFVNSIGLDNGLAPDRRQAIIWTNAHPIHWRLYAALGRDELKHVVWFCESFLYNIVKHVRLHCNIYYVHKSVYLFRRPIFSYCALCTNLEGRDFRQWMKPLKQSLFKLIAKMSKMRCYITLLYYIYYEMLYYPLATGKFEWNFRHVIFKQILVIDGWGISC